MRLSLPFAALAAVSLLVCGAAASRAQTITDITLFRQNAAGDSISEGWNSRGGDGISNLYLKSGASFINSGNGAAARITLDVSSPGTYTYSFFGENVNGNTAPSLGINFFANNAATPAISARGANDGTFTASSRTTSGVVFEAVAGANALSFTNVGRQITLSAFTYNTTSGGDFVQSFNNVPGGTTDTIGSFTLSVSGGAAVPESGTFALVLPSLILLGGVVARRRNDPRPAGVKAA